MSYIDKNMGQESRSTTSLKYLYAGILSFVFCSMIIWTWRKWPDVLIDFGREVYIPWQISTGTVLYRDINHFFGPASHYFNAIVFYLFGPSCTVIFATNIVLLAILICIVYQLIIDISNSLTAFLCCLIILTIFSVSQHTIFGSCNFIAPYSHEATHGIILSMIAMSQLIKYLIDYSLRRIICISLLVGLILMMKTEIFISIMSASIFLIVMKSLEIVNVSKKWHGKDFLKHICLFIVMSLVPLALFFIYFITKMSIKDTLHALWGPWERLLNTNITGSYFYKSLMGVDDIPGNLTKMIFGAIIVAIIITISISNYPRSQRLKDLIRYSCSLAITCYILFCDSDYLSYSIPILMAIAFFWLLKEYCQATQPVWRMKTLSGLLLTFFSFIILGKMLLKFTFYDTGFYLALPATLVLIVMSTFYIPSWLDQRSRNGASFRNAALIVIVISIASSLHASNEFYKLKTYSVGSGVDRIVTYKPEFDLASSQISRTLEWLSKNVLVDETYAVLPEGVILNFLTKHRNRSKNINFMPPEIAAFGEDRMVQNFINNPPDYILLVHKETSNFGVGYFGSDPKYGMEIMTWIVSNYLPLQLFGEKPLVKDQFGIQIYKNINQLRQSGNLGT